MFLNFFGLFAAVLVSVSAWGSSSGAANGSSNGASLEAKQSVCKKPYLFFDVGGTLVDTDTHKFNPMLLATDADSYLKSVKKHGYPMGIVSDVPEVWGRDLPDVKTIQHYPTAKWMRFLNFMRGKYPDDKASWKGPKLNPRYFGSFKGAGSNLHFEGRVFLPSTTAERKKNGSSILYDRAYQMAQAAGCKAVYLSSDEKEMEPARKAGLIPFLVGAKDHASRYLPVGEIDKFVATQSAAENLGPAKSRQ